MPALDKDKSHLYRMALLFAAGLLAFLVLRAVMVPKGFGRYGHFRAGALTDVRSLPISYAGRAACADCHSDIVDMRKGSLHAQIGCEACHGPLEAHAADPDTTKPQLPNGRALCLGCHLENVAKPASFPQVDPKEHGDAGPCTSCHNPHHPEIS